MPTPNPCVACGNSHAGYCSLAGDNAINQAVDLQLAADVRTLSEWAKNRQALEWSLTDCIDRWCVTLSRTVGGPITREEVYGPTPEAAIHAAAEAVQKDKVQP